MNEQTLWEDCVAFHGHACGGLTIGYKASLYAMELLGLSRSQDESVVCITENDACGVDAIQVILGCSIGKGNLLFHLRGKQAFSFYERNSGKSVRLVLRPTPDNLTNEEKFHYLQSKAPAELFDVKETVLSLPERARLLPQNVVVAVGNSPPSPCCGWNMGSWCAWTAHTPTTALTSEGHSSPM